jgi:nicotinamidase-related amidase
MSNSAYLVLDMQNDLIHPDGPSGKSPMGEQVRSRGIIEKTAEAIRKARAAGVTIGYVRVGFSPEYVECPRSSPVFGGIAKAGLLKLGTWGAEVHELLAPQPGDLMVIKHRVSPFYSTTLEAQLRAQGITRIFCSGVSTQAVVQATVREGHDRDYEMVVLEDCCAAHSAEEHANSIGSLRRFCTVTISNEVSFE